MKFPKVFKLKSAAHDRAPFDLSGRTITTGEFFQFCPVKMIEAVPGDKFTIDMKVFARTAPLAVPSFDRAVIQTRAFFVPSRLCYPYFNEFITGEKVQSGDATFTPSLPKIESTYLTDWFASGQINGEYLAVEASPTSAYDFSCGMGESLEYYTLTALGRRILKIFQGLGYRWNWAGGEEDQSLGGPGTNFSAMPLFAFFKAYVDWFVPSQLQAAHPITGLLNKWKGNTVPGASLTVTELNRLFESVCPAYDEDYFTAAWLYPNEVGGDSNRIAPGMTTGEIMYDYGSESSANTIADRDRTYTDKLGTHLYRSGNATIARLSDYALNLLEGMANYVTRNNYAGSRAVEQILARFGVRVPDTRLQRSEFIGANDTDVQFQEVTSMADSGDYKVGEYAGKGVAYGEDGKWTIECKEYGYIIIVSTIVPKISYVQGYDRAVKHLGRFDFFTPEFDCVGPQAIAVGELYADMMHPTSEHNWNDLQEGNGMPVDIFGYCPRYSEYKIGHDLLLGDFNLPSLNDGGALNGYHFSRMFYPSRTTPAKAQGPFLFADGEQYNRLFNVVEEDKADHFYMWYHFNIKALRPMRSIADSIPLDGDGEKIAQQPNGVHLS